MKSALIAQIASLVPVNVWHTACGCPPLLPYYHMVSDESLPHVRPLYRYRSVRRFSADLDFFLKYFRPIGLDELLGSMNSEKELPARAFCLSFDDGFREMAEIVAPILRAKGVPAIFFVNSGFVDNFEMAFHAKLALVLDHLQHSKTKGLARRVDDVLVSAGITGRNTVERVGNIRYANRSVLNDVGSACELDFDDYLKKRRPYLASEQIRRLLRDGFFIGGHSVDHPLYRDLTLREQLEQTRQSMDFVRDRFGVKDAAFAFPHMDDGVRPEFFEAVHREGIVQISFGTGGMLDDERRGHWQRFSMEKTFSGPAAIVSRQYARRWCRQSKGTRRRAAVKSGSNLPAELLPKTNI